VFSEHCCQLLKPFLASVRATQKDEPLKLGFLGIDFMVDVEDKLWLLEIHHGPCFPTSETHPLFDVLYSNFWRHVGEEIILPLFESRNPSVQANFIVL
jgi:tubulin--tyrosine ligase